MPLRDFTNNNFYLDGLKKELGYLNINLVRICSTFSDKQLNWSAKSGKWSILQHLEHIHLHNISFVEKSFNSLKRNNNRPDQCGQREPFRSSPLGSLYINSISADSQLKMRALPSFVPSNQLDRSTTLERFKTSTNDMFKLIEATRQINLSCVRLTVPGCNLLFHLGDVLQIIVQHTNRHLHQIKSLVSLPGFPKQ